MSESPTPTPDARTTGQSTADRSSANQASASHASVDSDGATRTEPGDSGEPALGYRLMADLQRVLAASSPNESSQGQGTPADSIDAFRPIYEAYAPRVMQFFFRMCGDRSLAEDLTQDVFVKVWRAAPSWRPEAPLHTWIFTIARYHGWNALAFRRRRKSVWQQAADQPAVNEPADSTASNRVPHERLAAREFGTHLQRAVLSLSPRLRVAFVLARFERLSLAEIAHIAGAPIGTIKSRIARAEKRLRRALSHSHASMKGGSHDSQ